MRTEGQGIVGGIASCVLFCMACDAYSQTLPTFTASQAERGKSVYAERCAKCHGKYLQGGEFGPPLRSFSLMKHWAGQPLSEMFSKIKSTMPPGSAGSMPDTVYAEVTAYILDIYGVKPGTTDLPIENASLATMTMPGERTLEVFEGDWSGGLAPGATVPMWPIKPSPLEHIAPVTDSLLSSPPPGSWLSWRRTLDAGGFSPLVQIDKDNVRRLQVAWTFSLPAGPNEATPLVHDGVVFVYSFGDHLQALDAATGDELWHYSHKLPSNAGASVHRNIALYEDNVYIATSDSCVVAIKAKTGELVWSERISDPGEAESLASGGPLVVQGVVMQGLAGFRVGGNYIVGLDAATGKRLWRFNTVAQPGEPNGSSWNDLPIEKRSGGGVWTPGSYDTESHLAFFGPSPTYDTGPLQQLVRRPGVSNDALYTDTTVALNPKSGKLVWHYQHLQNDQWDFDWAFERQIVDLPVRQRNRRVVVTTGKIALYDALDAETGEYLFSLDLGLQNLITSVDSKTGKKAVDPARIPGRERTVTVCPATSGGKNWMPASLNRETGILYVPLVETCMDLLPMPPGERGLLSSGVRQALRPPSQSDGKYGRLQAIDLKARRTLWTMRQRAPQTTGVLATAGNLVFAGALDRWFTAYDANSGEAIWKVRLNDVSISTPISYLANGKQYIAIVVGGGFGQSTMFSPLVPEIHRPSTDSATVWTFALQE